MAFFHHAGLTQLYSPSFVFHWDITSFEVPGELRCKHCSLVIGQRDASLLQPQSSRHLTSEVFSKLSSFFFQQSYVFLLPFSSQIKHHLAETKGNKNTVPSTSSLFLCRQFHGRFTERLPVTLTGCCICSGK